VDIILFLTGERYPSLGKCRLYFISDDKELDLVTRSS
jgi:hypothetical protein